MILVSMPWSKYVKVKVSLPLSSASNDSSLKMFPIASKLLFQGIVVVAIDFTERYDEGVYVNVVPNTPQTEVYDRVRESDEFT